MFRYKNRSFHAGVLTVVFICATMLAAIVYAEPASNSTALPQWNSPAEILRGATDPQKQAPLLSSDLILFAAALEERRIVDDAARKSLEPTLHKLISEFNKALEERLYAWRNGDELLNSALGNLISDFAVIQRFYSPQQEYKLFYEKSVQIRLAAFENRRQNASLRQNSELLELLPAENGEPGQLARMYSAEYPLSLEQEADRVSALLLVHLIKTTPQLQDTWRSYRRQAALLLGVDETAWDRIFEAARHLPLGRASDLCDEKIRVSFRDNLRRIFGDFTGSQSFNIKIQLTLLAAGNEPAAKSAASDRTPERRISSAGLESSSEIADNVRMSLYCVKHGQAAKSRGVSLLKLKDAYVEIAAQSYRSKAEELRARTESLSEIGIKDGGEALLQIASALDELAALEAIKGDGAVQISKAPAIMLKSDWLNPALSGATEYRCIYGAKPDENGNISLSSGGARWKRQEIEYLLPLEETPALEGNAELTEAPALVIPDGRSIIRLVTPRLEYRRTLESISTDKKSRTQSWQETPFPAVQDFIPAQL